MYCQNCRTPLKLDGSLESLNPAAFDLLVGSTGRSVPDHGAHSSSKPSFPQERRELYDRVSKQSTSPVYNRRSIPPPRQAARSQTHPARLARGDSGNMSFVMLTESQVGPPHGMISGANGTSDGSSPGNNRAVSGSTPANTSNHPSRGDIDESSFADQVERTARLFDIISARSDIDHPICLECTDLLIEGMEKRLADSKKERDAYSSFLRDLKAEIPTAEEFDAAQQSLKDTLAAEEAAFAELLALEKEKAGLDEEIALLEAEARQLDLEEEKFWRDRNAFALTLSEFQNERDALNMKYDHDSRQLERLQRTNVYNDAFCIGHDGFFGTINGLRLGRLANPSVDWPEINAAWGQTALLLATVASKLGFQFQGYQLKPMGSMSRIDRLEPSRPSPAQSVIGGGNAGPSAPPKITTLDLFSSGELPLNLPWLHRRFDNGMVAFLECLRQLGEYVEKTPAPATSNRRGQPTATVTGLKLPYEIKKDRIGDASIKLGFNQNDETWTRACKYTLTCCKFLLAHTSNIASAGSGSSAAMASAAVAAGEQAASSPTK
ncbi:beclin 1 [Aspergillus saccharolyticus JOP 1030-1]|uniref:Putative autophagy protein Apg6 n=1 Tax=Aspergillus saccharolyticus JOP 1030-1 TaxID=1450539 RepID=A0A318Z4D6_9EURO|nr:putative autophagy protein Apg6 [Aspergillus saccharolyticus JOP 1030-1]PYH41187.1 putative autophagy protein Apg6 [Aspergillus saccharolyticus JOP 1030-1]